MEKIMRDVTKSLMIYEQALVDWDNYQIEDYEMNEKIIDFQFNARLMILSMLDMATYNKALLNECSLNLFEIVNKHRLFNNAELMDDLKLLDKKINISKECLTHKYTGPVIKIDEASVNEIETLVSENTIIKETEEEIEILDIEEDISCNEDCSNCGCSAGVIKCNSAEELFSVIMDIISKAKSNNI